MSRDIIVLTPNGRRIKVQCTTDTNILQVLEDVCLKQGFQSDSYDLKHHNKILDLTTTIRFCNLPNKAMLEMVETEKKRVETNVVIGLHLEDGERRTGDFPSKTTLFDLISSLAPNELSALKNPTIMYMRQEVIGLSALRQKTLRQLGLLTGRAILRLLDKGEQAMQANVSTVYRRTQPDRVLETSNETTSVNNDAINLNETAIPGPSNVVKNIVTHNLNHIKLIKNEMALKNKNHDEINKEINEPTETDDTHCDKMDIDEINTAQNEQLSNTHRNDPGNLERRLKIEEEVVFLGTQKAVAFMQPDEVEEDLCDLPDDFYDLTIEEVRKMYRELQQRREELENSPLITNTKREEHEKQMSEQKLKFYKHVVVRIQFPDNIILQGVFDPTNTLEDVTTFVKSFLQNPEKPFRIFTTPLKENMDPKTSLIEAKFVPCVHMHFKWLEESSNETYLRDEIYSKKTSSDAASILASKYRAPSRRKTDASDAQKPNTQTSTKQTKVPIWFRR